MTTHPPAVSDRWIRLDGPLNFRDLGGYRVTRGTVRTGMLFRSDGLDTLTPTDLDLIRDRLGIRRVIDLRSTTELVGVGMGLLDRSGIEHHHVPIFDQTQSMLGESSLRIGDMYRTMLTAGAPRFVAGLALIADSDAPTVFHCMAGKDRTGLLAALLLSLLGVSDDDVCTDYALSSEIVPGLRSRLLERIRAGASDEHRPFRHLEGRDDLVNEILSARPATIRVVLDELRDRHGGVEGWLRSEGLADDHVERLRANLVG